MVQKHLTPGISILHSIQFGYASRDRFEFLPTSRRFTEIPKSKLSNFKISDFLNFYSNDFLI